MNITNVTFNNGTVVRANPLYQFDYGQILAFPDIELPTFFEVQFCNTGNPETISMIGEENSVEIPDELLLTGKDIEVYIFLHEGEGDGETEYRITIPVFARPQPSDIQPTEIQQNIVEQAMEALADADETLDEIKNLQVNATTLPAGSQATATYSDGVLDLGIPKGDTGEDTFYAVCGETPFKDITEAYLSGKVVFAIIKEESGEDYGNDNVFRMNYIEYYTDGDEYEGYANFVGGNMIRGYVSTISVHNDNWDEEPSVYSLEETFPITLKITGSGASTTYSVNKTYAEIQAADRRSNLFIYMTTGYATFASIYTLSYRAADNSYVFTRLKNANDVIEQVSVAQNNSVTVSEKRLLVANNTWRLFYGMGSRSGSTVNVTLYPPDGFSLVSGVKVAVTMNFGYDADNTSSTLSLNVNGTGAKPIGVAIGNNSSPQASNIDYISWINGDTIIFTYTTSGVWNASPTIKSVTKPSHYVFSAFYGYSTFEEVKTAYEFGKLCMCLYYPNYSGMMANKIGYLEEALISTVDSSLNYFKFRNNLNNETYILTPDDEWVTQ